MGFFDPGMGIVAGEIRGQPKMPAWNPLNIGTEQQTAISNNQAAMPAAESLVGEANKFSQQQIEQMLQAAIPGYESMKSGVSSTINDLLGGKIPEDVNDAIMRSDAARSLGGGYGGSGMSRDLVARDLGMTSLGLMEQGVNSAEKWISTMASIEQPGMMNLSSMFITPQQQAAFDVEERDKKFQYDWSKNLLKWQGSFGYLMGNEIDQDSAQFNEMATSIVGKVAGAAMGGI